ncbi:flagellar basal body-associated protein FliL [Pseudoalteromonas luteoviolacea]|uniref:Flagellar protein FliL n=1 Tax=Pseudoalteromonas luteoviolacea S4054 TaxID=1129367 RepID=A0A0F6A7B5_9GAMM|nr:flagellar basal body-associated protein FliL [Pseudoalteromonas luteoviolacea]AOT07494.1 flagellar basal body-associated protein FliL [Pseudoalteromonas luteoviolacea]AOT12410.1 flagellar basal body-associated protein FliL [Pseudoalteromonas luteoviolacea]AOT17323.1 flagellar basal body-associated protein FliL [Pseudoalteromonas luteoviolacea]KKE82008.1 flagellar basal body protein FliL [Pseudoalteromonas luteoviolacea S4054]KZN74202.1 flagellar basal body protein FliL [Pseudoalteromonas lu
MAEETDLEIEEAGGSKKKLIIIIAAVVVILGGVAGFFLMSGGEEEEASLAEESTAVQEDLSEQNAAEMGSALYVAMPRPFVFNVPGASRDRIVQIKVQLLVRGDVNEEVAKKHIPLIEGTLLGVFSTTTADELSTSAGKETLRLTALDKVQAAMEGVEGSKVIERVLFTGFVMQ